MPHRVCHMSTAHPTFDNRIFQKECVSLANAGFETHLVIQGKDCERSGVRIHGLQAPNSRIDRMINLVNKALSMALEVDAEIYHLHDPELLRIADKLLKAKKHVIFDSHEYYRYQIAEKDYLPKPVAHMAAKAYGVYEKDICRRIDAVIVPCTRRGVNPFEGRSRRTVFIDNYPILNDSDIKPVFDRTRSDTICYVGGLSHNRGITHLIKAGHKAKVRVLLAGPITESYLTDIKAMPEYNCVEYRGILDKSGVQTVISESFCGAAALLNVGQYWLGDNLPTKAYEYMAGGIPFIVSPTEYAMQFAEKFGCCKVVNPESIDEYAEAIEWLRENKEMASMMAKQGYAALKDKFNWETEARKLQSLYESILGSNK